MYLLDTDHISILQRQSAAEYAALMSRLAEHPRTDIAFSIVSFHEQILGCHTYISRARRSKDVARGYTMLGQVLRDFAVAHVVPFDLAAAQVSQGLLERRVRVATMDLRIASIALSRDMVLVTRNVRDFSRVPRLQIEDWSM